MLGTSYPSFADGWAALMGRGLIEGSVVLLLVLAVWWPLRRRAPAQLGYGLFLLVLVKLMLPLPLPLPFPGWLAVMLPGYHVGQVLTDLQAGPTAAETSMAVATPIATTPTASALTTWLLCAWACVVVVLLARFVLVQLRTTRLVRGARLVDPDHLPDAFTRACQRLGVTRRVALRETRHVDGPAVGGLIRPYVLLPVGLRRHLSPAQLEWVLLHELAHIRRGDLYVSLVQRLVQIAFFFHPAVWIANRIIDEQREFACDDAALVASTLARRECGQSFVQIVEWSHHRRPVPAATLAMFHPKHANRRRLMRILDPRRRPAGRASLASAAGILAMGLLVLPTAEVVHAQEPTKKEIRKLRKKLDKLQSAHDRLRARLDELERRRDHSQALPGMALPPARVEFRRGRWNPLPPPAPDAPKAPPASRAPRGPGATWEPHAPRSPKGPRAPKTPLTPGKGNVLSLDDVTNAPPAARKDDSRKQLPGARKKAKPVVRWLEVPKLDARTVDVKTDGVVLDVKPVIRANTLRLDVRLELPPPVVRRQIY